MLHTLRNLNESSFKKPLLEQIEVKNDETSEPTEKEYDNFIINITFKCDAVIVFASVPHNVIAARACKLPACWVSWD
jgi:hypothetical protein